MRTPALLLLLVITTALHGAEAQPISSATPTEQWEMTGEGRTPAASRVEELFNTVGARVVVQKLAAQWDAGAVHATFTALEIWDPRTDRVERGLRIEMSRPGINDVVFVDATVFPALRRVMAHYTAHLPKAEDCGPTNPSGGRIAWLWDTPRGVVHLLNTGVYFDAGTGSPGFLLGRAFKTPGAKGDFQFPKTLPETFVKMLDVAEGSFSPPGGSRE